MFNTNSFPPPWQIDERVAGLGPGLRVWDETGQGGEKYPHPHLRATSPPATEKILPSTETEGGTERATACTVRSKVGDAVQGVDYRPG